MRKLVLIPDAPGYASTDPENVLYTKMDGGYGRFEADKVGGTKMVDATWTMNQNEYQYWRAFYITETQEGAKPFLCDLLSEDGQGPVEHECSIIPGSVQLPSQQGKTYIQRAQLEVIPIPHDEEADDELMDLWEYNNGDPSALFEALERLANISMPLYLGEH